jgi:cation diffusion facilitator CzcD-associated flavoprotein CzcO
MLYSFSFEPRYGWPHVYSGQAEIQRYLEHCVDKYGLRPHLRLGAEVAGARFEEAASGWRLRLRDGEESEARVLVTGTGQLNRPHLPDLPGLDAFEGVSFHSAQWNHDHDLTGRRVAVIGNGASAVQFVPHVARVAERLTLFQRSAHWIIAPIPRNRAYTAREHWAFEHVPGFARLHRELISAFFEARFPAFTKGSRMGKLLSRLALQHLRSQIANPRLREVLTPDYPIGCKRVLVSTDYYPALARDNVQVVPDAVTGITSTGVVANGETYPADTLIFGTGFDTQGFLAPMELEGLGGRRLHDVWRDGAEAYLGLAVTGFPNLFLLYGPNTNLAHQSIIVMLESQIDYVVQCVERLRRERLGQLEVRAEVQARFNATLQRDLTRRVWDAGCSSWYKNEAGKVTNNWVGTTLAYRRLTRHPNPDDFVARPAE